MELEDIVNFQFKRENPFEGLVIDADIWRDAHNYHRDHQRLHILAFHRTGIVGGLEVTANKPADLSITVHPGMGIDPRGSTIIVSKAQRHTFQRREKGTVYLVIQFSEVAQGPYQPPDGGQPTRILEAYRIQEREKLPAEPHLELARIDFDPSDEAIRDAKTPSNPGKNEIDLRFRQEAAAPPTAPPAAPPVPVAPERPSAPVAPPSHPRETITLGHVVMGGASKDLHVAGLRNLAREISLLYGFEAGLKENISLEKDMSQCNIIYLTGNASFELTAKQQADLGRFLESGGTIFGEGCSEEQAEAPSTGAKEFGLAFNQLASQLGLKLESVQCGHPLLSAAHMFSAVPQGAQPGMLLEGGHMVYSASDYGCAWQGGHQGDPLPREIIRSSIELGANIVVYSQVQRKA
ncbi:MAG: DUF4159 domain-containing protein [Desulfobacterales bacterium]|nr:DUF4159 domain-containing protein [Desulfobacterales bacterium]